jgi:hypothetical protein
MSLIAPKDGRSRAVFVSVTATFILASIFVAARLITRAIIIKHRGWDNYCILLAWVSTLPAQMPRN